MHRAPSLYFPRGYIFPEQWGVTPGKEEQTVLPDEGYNYLSQVVVNAIPYAESENSAGGLTVTIG